MTILVSSSATIQRGLLYFVSASASVDGKELGAIVQSSSMLCLEMVVGLAKEVVE